MKLTDNLDMHKILDEFEFRPVRAIGFGVPCTLVQKIPNIRPCLEHNLFSFDWIFMRVADNLGRHRLSYEFEFRQDRTICIGVTCP